MITESRIALRMAAATNRGKAFTVFEPLQPIEKLFMAGIQTSDRFLYGTTDALRTLSNLVSLASDHADIVVHVPLKSGPPKWLSPLIETSLHLAFCHHSLQLRYSDWKEVRNRLGKWETLEKSVVVESERIRFDYSHWTKKNADVVDLKEAANTQFIIGSKPILEYFASGLLWLSSAPEGGEWHLHLGGHSRHRNPAAGFSEDLITFTCDTENW